MSLDSDDEFGLFDIYAREFKTAAESARHILHGMLNTIENGTVPSTDTITSFNGAMQTLQIGYDAMYSSAEKLLQEEVPQKGQPLSVVEEAVLQRYSRIQDRLKEAECILSEFLEVEALSKDFMDVLQDARGKAHLLLARIREKAIQYDVLDEEIRPYQLFLKVVDLKQDNIDEHIQILDELDAYFPPKVGRGLCLSRYRRPSTIATALSTDGTEAKAGNEFAPVPDEHFKAPVEESPAATAPEVLGQTETKDSGMPLHGSYDDEALSEGHGDMIDIALRNFSRDMEKFLEKKFKSDREYIVFFQLIACFCIITEEQICDFAELCGKVGKNTKGKLSSAMNLLVGKGYVRRIKAPVQALTLPGDQKASIFRLFRKCRIDVKLPFNSRKNYEKQERESIIAGASAQNACLLRYLKGWKKKNPKIFKDLLESVMLYNASQKVSVFWKEEYYLCNIALDNQDLSKGRHWLFVPQDKLPELHGLLEENVCFAFLDGVTYRWTGGWTADESAMPQERSDEVPPSETSSSMKDRELTDSDNDAAPSASLLEPEAAATTAAEENTPTVVAQLSAEPSREIPQIDVTVKEEQTISVTESEPSPDTADVPSHATSVTECSTASSAEESALPSTEKVCPPKDLNLAPGEKHTNMERKTGGSQSPAVPAEFPGNPPCTVPETDIGSPTDFTAENRSMTDVHDDSLSEIPNVSPDGDHVLPKTQSLRRPIPSTVAASSDTNVASSSPTNVPNAAGNALREDLFRHETMAETAGRLAESRQKPSDAELYGLITRLLEHSSSADGRTCHPGHIAQALMLAQAAIFKSPGEMPRCEHLYEQLQLATAIESTVYRHESNEEDAESGNYAGYYLNQLFSGEYSQSLALAAYLHALFAPGHRDYNLQVQAEMYLREYDSRFPAYPSLKPLFTLLCEVQRTEPSGFTPAVLLQLKSEEGKNASMKELRKRAARLMSEPNIKTYMHGIPELSSNQFGIRSDLHKAMEIISKNDASQREFLELLISDFCHRSDETYVLNERDFEAFIDSAWSTATKKLSTQKVPLQLMARKQIRQAFLDRIEVMREWLESAAPIAPERVNKLRKLKTRLLQELNSVPADFGGKDPFGHYPGVVIHMLEQLRSRLEQTKIQPIFADALRTGFISLDDRFQPVFYDDIQNVRYYEPWRRVLFHVAQPNMTVEEAGKAICSEPDSPLFDNLQQLKLLSLLQGHEDENAGEVEKGKKRSCDYTGKFNADLELDYATGRVTEQDKEDLLEIIRKYQDEFFETKDFGCWKQFLSALERQKNDKVEVNRKNLKNDIVERRRGADSGENILSVAERYLEDGQFAMAEEYLNIFDSRDKEYEEELKSILKEDDEFSLFLKDFDAIYDECRHKKERHLAQIGPEFLERHYPEGWTDRHKKESRQFISKWPTRKGMSKIGDIVDFVKALGIDVVSGTKVYDREEVFELEVSPQKCNHVEYQHPIAEFGTKLMTPLSVVVLFGNHMPREMVNDIMSLRQLNPNGTAIVLLDYALPKDLRCQLAESCHQYSNVRFIVIDRVLALYLALHEQSERLAAMLNCALPYAAAPQPFLCEGGKTPEEMFCGRTRELDAIRDLNGATLVYGGRQLGKTALLQRVQSLTHMPKNRDFAIFCDIKDVSNEVEVTKIIISAINGDTPLAMPPCDTMYELCEHLEKRFRNGSIQTMRLMIDEADAFLRAMQNYAPLRALINLKRNCPKFKFVLAGLNNVYRTRKATMDNGDFGQLGQPLCIKPLSPSIALRFVLRPLRYLGFQPADGDEQLNTILSCTNYYPGILHLFGYTLVQLLNEKYALYFKASEGHPPFQLKQELLSAAAAKLNESIKEKFLLSLKLDDRYFMLARCIGMLYYYEADMYERYKGYTIKTIRDMADSYDIRCLAPLSGDECEALLDEMAEMGILHRTEPGVYRLRKRSLLDIIGADMDRLDAEIREENERSLNA